MNKKKITINDIAREMGVSITTVSFVLNGKAEGRVGASLARRIKSYADKVGYRPHSNRGDKRHARLKLFGVLINDVSDPFQSELVFQLEERLKVIGGHVVMFTLNRTTAEVDHFVKALGRLELSGYVFNAGEGLLDHSLVARYCKGPVVIFDGEMAGASSIRPNYAVLLQKLLTDNLDKQGLEQVGLVSDSADAVRTNGFIKGYMAAMDTLFGDVLVKKLPSDVDVDVAKVQIRDFMRDNQLHTVVFSSDSIARLALDILQNDRMDVHCLISPSRAAHSRNLNNVRQLALPLDAAELALQIAEALNG